MRVLVDLGFAKDQGEGIPRMFAEMEDAFLPSPDVEAQGQQVMVTLRNTSTLTTSDRRFVAGLGDAELSRGEFRALLMAYRRDRVDNARLRAAMGLDTLGASQLLRGLRDRDLLTLHSHGAGSYYTLSPAAREHIGESPSSADLAELGADGHQLDPGQRERTDPIDTSSASIDTSSAPDRHQLRTDQTDLSADLQARIQRLGSRPRRSAVRDILEAICLTRDWTTSAELSRFLSFGQRNLRRRHLTPMVEDGRLQYRHPDRPSHPAQAYHATRRRLASAEEDCPPK